MTKTEQKRVEEIYGPDYQETDIPTYIRKSEADQSKANDIQE